MLRLTASEVMAPSQTRPSIEVGIKAQKCADSVTFHDSDMNRIPSRQRSRILDDLAGAKDVGLLYGKDFVSDIQDHPERRCDRFPAVDRRIAMQNFLKHLGIRHQPFAIDDETLQQYLGIGLVRVRRSDQIHRHIRIDENHDW